MISQNSLDKVCKARAVSSDGEITAGDLLEQIIELNKEHAASELEWEKRYVKRGEVLTKLEEALKEAHTELDEAMKYQVGLKKELTNLQTSLATEKNAISHLAHSTTGLLKRAETVEAELAASREMGPCGKHPNMFWVGAVEGTPIPIPEKKFRGEGRCDYCGSQIGSCAAGEFCTNKDCGYIDGWYNQRRMVEGHCTICAELAASRADAYRVAIAKLNYERGGRYANDSQSYKVMTWAIEWVGSLITPTDAAARDERDRRIRLEEQERCLKPLWSLGCEIKKIGISLDQRETADEFLTIIESLRAPVPAERAGDAVCPTCKGVDAIWMRTGDFTKRVLGPCPDCHGTGRAKIKENNATD